jgi:hypothetical protein
MVPRQVQDQLYIWRALGRAHQSGTNLAIDVAAGRGIPIPA